MSNDATDAERRQLQAGNQSPVAAAGAADAVCGFVNDRLGAQAPRDGVFARFRTSSDIVITGHQRFCAEEALTPIANVAVDKLDVLESGGRPRDAVSVEHVA